MKKLCTFYHQGNCKFKQIKASKFSCFMCTTFYKDSSGLDNKELYTIANTNKNFKLQLVIAFFSLCLSIFVIYDRQLVVNKTNLLSEDIKKLNIKLEKITSSNYEKLSKKIKKQDLEIHALSKKNQLLKETSLIKHRSE